MIMSLGSSLFEEMLFDNGQPINLSFVEYMPPSMEDQDGMTQVEDLVEALHFIASLPERTCVIELVIAPTCDRFYICGLETPRWRANIWPRGNRC